MNKIIKILSVAELNNLEEYYSRPFNKILWSTLRKLGCALSNINENIADKIVELDISNLSEESSKAINKKYPYIDDFSLKNWMEDFVNKPSKSYLDICLLLDKIKRYHINRDNWQKKDKQVKFLKLYSLYILKSNLRKEEDIKNLLFSYLDENSIDLYSRMNKNHQKYLNKIYAVIEDYGFSYREYYALKKEYFYLEKDSKRRILLKKIIKVLNNYHKNPCDIKFNNLELSDVHFDISNKIRNEFFNYGVYRMEYKAPNIIKIIDEYIKFPSGGHSTICYGFTEIDYKYNGDDLTRKDYLDLYDKILLKVKKDNHRFSRKRFLNQINLEIEELNK